MNPVKNDFLAFGGAGEHRDASARDQQEILCSLSLGKNALAALEVNFGERFDH